MKHKGILVIALVFLLLTATDTNAIECSSCTECSNILSSDTTVVLTQDISVTSGSCISQTAGSLENTIIDCNGHNIIHYGSLSDTHIGINLHDTSNLNIRNCKIEGFSKGIIITTSQAPSSTLRNLTITNSSGSGIKLVSSDYQVNIVNNTISNNCLYESICAGIMIYDSAGHNISYNYLQSNNYGIQISETSSNNQVKYNIITNNRDKGIYLESGEFNDIQYNKIRNNSQELGTKYEISIAQSTTNRNNIISHNAFKFQFLNNTEWNNINSNIYSDLNVGPQSNFLSDYPTISQAVATSSSGYKIHVFPGTYADNVTIDKPVTIETETKSGTIIINDTNNPLRIESDNVRISNLTLISSGPPAIRNFGNNTYFSDIYINDSQTGIRTSGSTNSTFTRFIITNTDEPISTEQSTLITISDSMITGGTDYSISLDETSTSSIINNIITNPIYGITLTNGCHSNNISYNTITGTTTTKGIYSLGPSPSSHNTQNTYYRNTINDADTGISLTYTTQDNITSNTINSSSSRGISIEKSDAARIENNSITLSNDGIYIYTATESIFRFNDITGNTRGMRIERDLPFDDMNNNITYNTFLQNTEKDIDIDYSAKNNNIWMNNFTKNQGMIPYNTYNYNYNNYCIMGLDNYYPEDIENNEDYEGRLLCRRLFSYSANDSIIYLGHALNITADTREGESSYDTINITITKPDNTNTSHTMQINGTDRIDNIWSLIYTLTTTTGSYFASLISYIESDNDTGQKEISASELYFRVIDLAISTLIRDDTYHINDTITIEATIQDNASEITNITSRIYWNNTLVDTAHMTHLEDQEGHDIIILTEESYDASTTTNVTRRSGNYTVNTTVYAGIEKTNTSTFFIEYGSSALAITSPNEIAKNKDTNITYMLRALNGDLDNITLTFTSSNTTAITTETDHIIIPYLNASQTLNLNLSLAGLEEGTSTINITATPTQGNSTSINQQITVRELTLNTWPYYGTINIKNPNMIYAEISGNITPIEYMTAELIWNHTSRLNSSYNYQTKYTEPSSGKTIYRYYSIIQQAYISHSGNYTVITRSKADIETNDTTHFFVKYGYADIILNSETIKMDDGESRDLVISLKAVNGDLENITVTVTSDNEYIANISATDTPVKTISFIANQHTNPTNSLSFNITGMNYGITNITINVTSFNSTDVSSTIRINVTGESESNPPSVTGIITNSSISAFNLQDNILVTARITDDSGNPKTQVAEITKPDNWKTNITMEWNNTFSYYSTQAPFSNTTQTGTYTIRIYTTDYYGNTNATETNTFNITDTYPTVGFNISDAYNRGENATITITAYDINNNTITGFNTTLNITYNNDTTTLLPGNLTNQYIYHINTHIIGIHNLTTNISKNGNYGNTTGSFNVSNTYYIIFDYPEESSRPSPGDTLTTQIHTVGARNTAYDTSLSINVTCYNDSSKTIKDIQMNNLYLNYYGLITEKCHASSAYNEIFNITAISYDTYNNSAFETIFIQTRDIDSSPTTSSSSSGGGGGSSGGAAGILPSAGENFTNTIYIGNNQTNTTTSFELSLGLEKGGKIQSGENETITAIIDNIGNTDIKVTLSIDNPCGSTTFNTKDIYISKGSTVEETIPIHIPLSTSEGTCRFTLRATYNDIEKTKSATISIEKNEYITRLETLTETIPDLEKSIQNHKASGIQTSDLEATIENIKEQISTAVHAITEDDLPTLKSTVIQAEKTSSQIPLKLLELKTEKWLRENRYSIAAAIAIILITSYLLLYFIIPYMYLKKERTALENKELELKDAEKSVQKQYFMRQLDDRTFNKLISEKHSLLLDTRSQLKRVDEKISLLKHGKLNLKDQEHSQYFILNRFRKSKQDTQKPTQNRPESTDRVRYLENQRYNINQSLKEAEKNYQNQIITAEEYTQIAENKKKKLENIEKELSSIQGNTPETQPQAAPIKKHDFLKNLRKRYTEYKLKNTEKNIKKKIHMLELKENVLKKKESQLKTEEDTIESEISTLEEQEKQIEKEESELKDSESPKPQ